MRTEVLSVSKSLIVVCAILWSHILVTIRKHPNPLSESEKPSAKSSRTQYVKTQPLVKSYYFVLLVQMERTVAKESTTDGTLLRSISILLRIGEVVLVVVAEGGLQ